MKIGILTLHGAINYGAVLQAYGLQTFLTRMGHEVEIINFMPDEVFGYYDYHVFSKPVTVRSVVSKTLRRKRNKAEYGAFDTFRYEHLRMSKRVKTETEFRAITSAYDAVVCGSDQIWNPIANGGRMADYYLKNAAEDARKVSYAASFGSVDTVKGREGEVKALLKGFDALSVREEEAATFVSGLLDVNVERLIDPSMLMKHEDFAALEAPIEAPREYILTYMLGANSEMARCVELAAQAMGLPIISLGRKMPGATFRKDIGPGEFLWLYAHASCVITSSFHGTAFSLLYGKPFLTFGNGAYNSRMETLLGIAQQEDRFCSECPSVEKIESLLTASPDPDFELLVAPERERAAKFLRDALDGE